MGKNIKILFIEDSEEDALLLLNEIRCGGFEPTFLRVETEADMRHALDYTDWDLIISDEKMPRFNATEALKISRDSGKDIPFIIVSGVIDEEIAINAMKSGAHDFINKNNLKRLVPAIERELMDTAERKKRRRAELDMQKSESRYRMLFERMMDAFALQENVRDENGRIMDFLYIDINDAFANMAGLAREKLIGKTIRETDPSAGDEIIERYGRISMTGDADHFEYYSDIFKKYFEVSAYRPREGLVASIVRDITLKKITEERQDLFNYILQTINRESSTQTIIQDTLSLLKHHYGLDAVALRLRQDGDYPYFLHDGFSENFIESQPTLCEKNVSGGIITDNEGKPRLACLCGLVISGKNGSARSLLTTGGSFWTNCLSDLLDNSAEGLSGVVTRNECMKEGYESIALIPLRSGDDTIGLLQFNHHRKNRFTPDLVEFLESVGLTVGIALKRRRSEEAITASLREKESLLKEIHHRVKNNLQVISSLMSLQALSIHDDDVSVAFQDIQNRIKSMAIIHEKLYLSENFSSIAFGDYIEEIAHSLFQSFNIEPGRIVFRSDIKDINLGIDTAVPCGLIINELITNSLKHAFPDGRKGEIFIAMVRDENGRYILSEKDNGIGIPQKIDIDRTPSLGLRLVKILTQQLNGSIEVRGNGGSWFIVQFNDATAR